MFCDRILFMVMVSTKVRSNTSVGRSTVPYHAVPTKTDKGKPKREGEKEREQKRERGRRRGERERESSEALAGAAGLSHHFK